MHTFGFSVVHLAWQKLCIASLTVHLIANKGIFLPPSLLENWYFIDSALCWMQSNSCNCPLADLTVKGLQAELLEKYVLLHIWSCVPLCMHTTCTQCTFKMSVSKLWRRRRKCVLTQKLQTQPPVDQTPQKHHLKVKLKMKEAEEESVKEELKPNSQENGGRKRGRRRIWGASEPQTKDGD